MSRGSGVLAVRARSILLMGAGGTAEYLFAHKVGRFSAPCAGQAAHDIDFPPARCFAVRTQAGKAAGELKGEATNDAPAGGIHMGAHIRLDMGKTILRSLRAALQGVLQFWHGLDTFEEQAFL